jgi:hypothetical protein
MPFWHLMIRIKISQLQNIVRIPCQNGMFALGRGFSLFEQFIIKINLLYKVSKLAWVMLKIRHLDGCPVRFRFEGGAMNSIHYK